MMKSLENLNTNEIINYLDAHLPCSIAKYWNCVPADKLLPNLFSREKLPSCIVANTKPENHPGEHWIAFIRTRKGLYFFDSYGKPVRKYGFQVNAQSHNKSLQGNSALCGVYCLLWIIYTLQYKSPLAFYKEFKRNATANDKKAVSLFKALKPCVRRKNKRKTVQICCCKP